MTIRFNTWVEGDSLEDAWEKLRLSLADKNMGDKLKERFTATQLEDGEQDKERMAPLTVKELMDYCSPRMCKDCAFGTAASEAWHGCELYDDAPDTWNLGEMAKIIKGEKV